MPRKAIVAIAALCYFVQIDTHSFADVFLLQDGTCLEGTVRTRTKTNLFITLADTGKNRNIPEDRLEEHLRGSQHHCPESPVGSSQPESDATSARSSELSGARKRPEAPLVAVNCAAQDYSSDTQPEVIIFSGETLLGAGCFLQSAHALTLAIERLRKARRHKSDVAYSASLLRAKALIGLNMTVAARFDLLYATKSSTTNIARGATDELASLEAKHGLFWPPQIRVIGKAHSGSLNDIKLRLSNRRYMILHSTPVFWSNSLLGAYWESLNVQFFSISHSGDTWFQTDEFINELGWHSLSASSANSPFNQYADFTGRRYEIVKGERRHLSTVIRACPVCS